MKQVRMRSTLRQVLAIVAVVAAMAAVAAPASAAESYRLDVSGANEVGDGDPDGFGSIAVSFRQSGVVCFDLRVSGIDTVVAAHIHEGAAGVNGGVVVNLAIDVNGLSGCVDADLEALDAIRSNPASYYVNVHTPEFPAGALRGQLVG